MENKEDTRKQDHEKLKAQEMKDWMHEKTYTRTEIKNAFNDFSWKVYTGYPIEKWEEWFDLNYPLNK